MKTHETNARCGCARCQKHVHHESEARGRRGLLTAYDAIYCLGLRFSKAAWIARFAQAGEAGNRAFDRWKAWVRRQGVELESHARDHDHEAMVVFTPEAALRVSALLEETARTRGLDPDAAPPCDCFRCKPRWRGSAPGWRRQPQRSTMQYSSSQAAVSASA